MWDTFLELKMTRWPESSQDCGDGEIRETEVGVGAAGLCVFPRALAPKCVRMWLHDPVGTTRTSPFVLLFVHPSLRQGEAGLAVPSGRVTGTVSQLAHPSCATLLIWTSPWPLALLGVCGFCA